MIDLNSDLGESFGAWRVGDDEAMFAVVSSANVACGFHAGDPLTMAESVGRAARHGVALGAHPGYRDLVGFGRRALDTSPAEIAAELLAQLGALDGIARGSGVRVRYVKAHGALYHRPRRPTSRRRTRSPRRSPATTRPCRCSASRRARSSGQRMPRASASPARPSSTAATSPTARSCPRGEPGAIVDDPAAAADRALELAETGGITADDGSRVELAPDSLCLHGDTPGAVAMARAVRAALEAAGIEIRAFA